MTQNEQDKANSQVSESATTIRSQQDRETKFTETQAHPLSANSGVANQQSNPTATATVLTDDQISRRRQLESFVDDFRAGKKSRIDTYSAILGELRRESRLTQEEEDTTFRLFSAEIDLAEARSLRQPAIAGMRDRK